ncbi:methionine--tRNA ligase subunit beta, partial [Candidatus Woesearchaeota archaeon]|nr:methionine--tRNA ligase subunit beta [Candidatus Woesearchaeota archaeon]
QFSKSRHVGVFGDDAVRTGIIPDIWRYYIIVNRPEKTDTEFQWDDFQKKINNELVANPGNLVNRTITFINNFFDKKVPDAKLDADDEKFLEELNEIKEQISQDLDKIELKEGLKKVMLFSKHCNMYFQKNEPWKKIKDDKERAAASLYVLANVVKDLSILFEPFMPGVAEKIRNQLRIQKHNWDDVCNLSIKPGHVIEKPEIIFKKLEDDELAKMKKEFGGKRKMDAFSKVDLRVAKVMSAEPHPDADKLVVLQIDVGELGKRQIVAGIRAYYEPQDLVDRNIVIVANLKPVKLRGVESNGMLLAAVLGKDLDLVSAPESKPGEKVFAEGIEQKPEKELSYDDFSKAVLTTKDHKIVYGDKVLKTAIEELSTDVGDGAEVR